MDNAIKTMVEEKNKAWYFEESSFYDLSNCANKNNNFWRETSQSMLLVNLLAALLDFKLN